MLGKGLDRDAIALALGVSPRQVAAVAAHLTMRTYDRPKTGGSDMRDASPSRTPKQRRSSGDQKKGAAVFIGSDIENQEPCYWTPTPEHGTANPHLLIVGESGSGKTYATQCICAELVQRKIPTIVFDFGQGFTLDVAPAGFIKYARPVELDASRDGININPLQIFPADVHGPINVAQRVADTFARVYPTIGVQQHAALRDAILQTFRESGIDPRTKRTWTNKAPRFGDLKTVLEDLALNRDSPSRRYTSAVASHISTVFVFNTFRASGLNIDWETILKSGAQTYIIQLKGLEHLLERVVTELLLWNLIGFLESIGPGPLRCMVLLDEAHRLSFATNSPVEKLLREGRKFGAGVVLASQQPEDFSSVAFANTATKLIFNVMDDRGAVARQVAKKAAGDTDFVKLLRRLGNLPRGTACFVTQSSAAIVQVASFEERLTTWALNANAADRVR
jgi:DNA phosphorothioation-dependent restriction protein DptH